MICVSIDSIKYQYIPLAVEPILTLSAVDVRNFDSRFRKSGVITEESAKGEFAGVFNEVLLSDSGFVMRTFDARIVLDVFFENGVNKITLVIDKNGFSTWGTHRYFWNKDMNDWLNHYVIFPEVIGSFR